MASKIAAAFVLFFIGVSLIFTLSVVITNFYLPEISETKNQNTDTSASPHNNNITQHTISEASNSTNTALSRDEMIEYMLKYNYRKSCLLAGGQSDYVKSLPLETCISYLVRTQGDDMRNKARLFSDTEVRYLYLEYKSHPH